MHGVKAVMKAGQDKGILKPVDAQDPVVWTENKEQTKIESLFETLHGQIAVVTEG